jgi:hypothetical protein
MSTSTGLLVGLFGLAVFGLLSVWSAGARTGRTMERQLRQVSRFGQVLGWSLMSAVVIGAGQWLTVTHTSSPVVLAGVIGLPALLAGVTVGRMLTVTTFYWEGPVNGRGSGRARRAARRAVRR